MSLKNQINESANQALTQRDELGLSVFRLLKSAIKNAEIEKGHELTEEETITVLEKQAKQRRDSIEQFEKANRVDLAEKEKAELEIISKFLPEKMGEEDVRAIVKEEIAQNEGADFGRIMGMVMGKLKGQADGTTVQKIVREELGDN